MEEFFPVLINLLLVILLVLANGFFVAAEFAIVRAHPAKLRSRENIRKIGTRGALKLIKEIDASLSATQLGITIASLLLGWWGEHVFQGIFLQLFTWLGEPYAAIASHAMATAVALVIITFLHVVIGELAAKSVAILYPEKTLRMLAGPMLVFTKLCRPLIVSLSYCSNLFLRMFGIRGVAEGERAHSSAELALLVSHSEEKGELDSAEGKMLRGVFGFGDTVAREVMTPRTDLVTIGINDGFPKVLAIIVGSGLSRFPVVGKNIDDVVGILLARDIMPYLAEYQNTGVKNFRVEKIMRPPYFIPGTKPVDELLNEMKHRKTHMTIVLDEHGGIDGVVTLEDLLEEIVGDIFDESDVPETDVIVEDNGDAVVDGGVLVAELNARFSLNIPEGDYDTVAGFIFTSLGRMAQTGDQILLDHNGILMAGSGDGAEGPSLSDIIEDLETEARGDGTTGAPLNGRPVAESNSGEPISTALLTVEAVEGHRIEKVRLQQFPIN